MDGHELDLSAIMENAHGSKLQGRLRLKNNNINSSQDILDTSTNCENEAQQICDNNSSSEENNKDKDTEEDSLADFKSPPKPEKLRKNQLNKYKIVAEKPKGKTRNKSIIKSRKSNANQPSIKSSLLKPQVSNQNQADFKEAVTCPVCLKAFKDDTTCTNHVKSCAAKNKVSIKQLLEAKRLQEHQAQERKAMGLLAAPVLQEKKKPFRSKNYTTGDDAQLQLVLAMSESLYEAENMVQLEEAAYLAGIPPEHIREMNDQERRKTLQSFGFTSNKPVVDAPTNRQRKKKLQIPTVLQTRSQQDKDRVLTERIACILTGDDALTQVEENVVIDFQNKIPAVIKSKLLKRIEKTDNKLWDQSRLTKHSHNFYVDALKSHIFKSAQQPVESDILLQEVVTLGVDKESTSSWTNSLVYEPMDVDVIDQKIEQSSSHCETVEMSTSNSNTSKLDLLENFSNNWKEALSDSSASDVIILVKNNKHIYAHKLVFHVQCSNILLDIESMDAKLHPRIDNKISWLDKDKIAALAFLEFVYSGTIITYEDVFRKIELVQQIEQLARVYKLHNLFSYIRENKKKFKLEGKQFEQVEDSKSVNKSKSNNQSVQNEFAQGSVDFNDSETIPFEMQNTQKKPSISLNRSKNLLTNHLIDRRITSSPDLFDSDGDEANNSKIKIEINLEDNENYNMKREVDDAHDSDHEESLCSQKTLVNLSRSVSPQENIHEAVTPPAGQSPQRQEHLFREKCILNEQEMTETITQKCQPSEITVEIKQEIDKSEKDDVCNALTPEYHPTAEIDGPCTPKKQVCTDMQVYVATHQDDADESIHTAVTPPRVPQNPVQTIGESKIKSELTMFIEKVQRRNERDILDTDSEVDTPDNRAKPKNPFSKRNQNDSCGYLMAAKDKSYHKAISLLEKDVLNDQKEKKYCGSSKEKSIQDESEHTKYSNPSTSKSLTSDGEVEDVTVDETEMSMYSKYKKNSTHDNSIAAYRQNLSFSGLKTSTKDTDDSKTSRCSVSQNVTKRKSKPRIIQDITLVSDSDEEGNSLKTFLRDKKNKKTDVVKKDPITKTPVQISNIEDDVTFPLELLNEPMKSDENPKVTKSTVLKSSNKVIDLSLDSDEDGIHDDSTIPNDLVNFSFNRQNSYSKDLSTNPNKRMELEIAEKKSEDIDAEISRILQSSQGKTDEENGYDKDGSRNSTTSGPDTERQVVDSSPIYIISSPDACSLNESDPKIPKKDTKDDIRNNCSQNKEGSLAGENGDFDSLAFDEWNVKTPPRETVRSSKSLRGSPKAGSIIKNLNLNESFLNNVEPPCLEIPTNSSKAKDKTISTLISSPILSQNKRSSRDSQEKYSAINSKLKKRSVSPEHNSEALKKLKVRSASASTLVDKYKGNEGSSLQRSSSFVSPKQNKKSSDADTVTTPPMNYSLLDTPDLQKELKKFGLKPQSRVKAKALLTHIHKETESQKRTSSTNSSSDEDEPPAKRKNTKKTVKQLETGRKDGSEAEKCSVIAEEMDFDDPDVASIFQNPVSIKDALFKLIKTNKELYNKVLTYEPLPLESLHAILKQNGFKCKINSLMDVLDEQCITFQVKTNKGDRTKKKSS